MEPMYLKDIEKHQGDDNYTRAIEMMRRAGPEYPQILHMFSYKMSAPLSPGIRELIAAYTSSLNACPF